jgi:hypothetical protein
MDSVANHNIGGKAEIYEYQLRNSVKTSQILFNYVPSSFHIPNLMVYHHVGYIKLKITNLVVFPILNHTKAFKVPPLRLGRNDEVGRGWHAAPESHSYIESDDVHPQ